MLGSLAPSSARERERDRNRGGVGRLGFREPFGPRLGAPVPLPCAMAERTVFDLGDWSL